MIGKGKYYWLLLLIPITFVLWFFVNKNNKAPVRVLPYFGKKKYLSKGDTSFHKVKPFCFTNQYNQKVTEETVNGKIYVTDFFFTTCQSICPIMGNELVRVYKEFKQDTTILILSHTVEPEVDSVPILLNYSKMHGVSDNKWLFLTGDKQHLYDMARTAYLLNNETGNGDEGDFIHTQNFALIDKERHLRGFYDGTDSSDITRLIKEIKFLKEEYDYKEKNK